MTTLIHDFKPIITLLACRTGCGNHNSVFLKSMVCILISGCLLNAVNPVCDLLLKEARR